MHLLRVDLRRLVLLLVQPRPVLTSLLLLGMRPLVTRLAEKIGGVRLRLRASHHAGSTAAAGAAAMTVV
jgi:hypothetical protein